MDLTCLLAISRLMVDGCEISQDPDPQDNAADDYHRTSRSKVRTSCAMRSRLNGWLWI